MNTTEAVGEISNWRYKQLSIFAVMGTLEMPASDVREVFDNRWETSPVEFEDECDVFEALHMDPKSPVHFIVNRNERPNRSYVKALSLCRGPGEVRLRQFFVDADFDVVFPTQGFIDFIRRYLVVDRFTYDLAVSASRRDGKPLEAVYGGAHYAEILRRQKGFSGITPAVINAAKKRFGTL